MTLDGVRRRSDRIGTVGRRERSLEWDGRVRRGGGKGIAFDFETVARAKCVRFYRANRLAGGSVVVGSLFRASFADGRGRSDRATPWGGSRRGRTRRE